MVDESLHVATDAALHAKTRRTDVQRSHLHPSATISTILLLTGCELEAYLKEHLTAGYVEAVMKILKVQIGNKKDAFDKLSSGWILQNLPKDAAREILFARADPKAIHPTHIHP